MRKANVYMQNELAGYLTETEDGYSFKYDVNYLNGSLTKPVSLTLPLQDKPYVGKTMFPFFESGFTGYIIPDKRIIMEYICGQAVRFLHRMP